MKIPTLTLVLALTLVFMTIIKCGRFQMLYFLILICSLYIIIDKKRKRNYIKRITNKYNVCKKPVPFKILRKINKQKHAIGIVSASLYGNVTPKFKKKYLSNIDKNIKKIKKYLPNWAFRIYTSENLVTHVMHLISKYSIVEIFVMHDTVNHRASQWRYLIAGENKKFIIVDLDDVFSKKIKDYIDRWEKSKKPFIIFSDYFGFLPMSGKSWGGKKNAIPDIKILMNKHCQGWFGVDEAFLKKYIHPRILEKGVFEPRFFEENKKIVIILSCFMFLFLINYFFGC